MSRFGRIEVVEQCFYQQYSGQQVRPFSLAARVRCRGFSLGLQRVLTDFGAEDSFEKATARVREHYRIEVGGSSVRRETLRHAEAMQFELETEVWMPESGVSELLAETDGTFVPIVKIESGVGDGRKRRRCLWREARLCLAGAVGSVGRRFRAGLGSPGQIGRQWRAAVMEAGGGRNTHLHCVGDGASWIIGQVREQFGEQASYLVDFYHVSGYLSAASEQVWGAGGVSQRWREEAEKRLKQNETAWVLAQLSEHLEAEEVPEEEAPVRRAVRYLKARIEHLDYKTALERGLPIGSGEVESRHRTVIQERLKKAGAWWLEENAEKMLALRCLRANQEWLSYWKSMSQAPA